MPLDVYSLWGKKNLEVCQVPKCTRSTAKRIAFMNYDMGNVCMGHWKEWVAVWDNGGLELEEAA